MAALIGVLNIIIIILVNFDHPDGSTSWDYICYYVSVKFHYPDGSTNWGYKCYYILA